MKLTTIIKEAKEINPMTDVSPGDFYTYKDMGYDLVFLVINDYPQTPKKSRWEGPVFNLKPAKFKEPYLFSPELTTAGGDSIKWQWDQMKKIKPTAKMKKQIQQILKDPEAIDLINSSGIRLKDIERFAR